MADIIPIDKPEFNEITKENKPEITLRFDPITQMGKIDIQINKNIELSKQRNKLYESLPKKEKPKYSNILFLYIDAISRPEFIRSMKETQKLDNFEPLELTENAVNVIYRRCAATEKTASNDIVKSYLFSKKAGFEENSGSFYMSRSQLQKNRGEIAYMLGQLYDVHVTEDGFIYLKNLSLNYNKLPWFESSDVDKVQQTIYNLISLGTTARNEEGRPLISGIIKEKGACMAADIMPTYSPKDPKFEEWSQSEKGKRLLLTFQRTREGGEEK
jgi:hypothetical protein